MPTTGSMIDEMYDLRENKKTLEAEIKEIKESMTLLEARLIEKLDSEDTTTSSGKAASVSISTQDVPMVEDWDAFHQYLIDNDALYLLQRRIASRAYKEVSNSGEIVPGVVTFSKRTISLRKLTK